MVPAHGLDAVVVVRLLLVTRHQSAAMTSGAAAGSNTSARAMALLFAVLKSATKPAQVADMNLHPALLLLLAVAVTAPAGAQTRRQSTASTPSECATRQGELPKTWEGEAYAIDGDTIAGIGLKPHIRLWGIQAPELRDASKSETQAGMRSRAALEDLLELGGRKVSCKVTKFDRYCRYVAQCTITASVPSGSPAAPYDFSLRLIEDGLAYGFYLDDALPFDPAASARYAHMEALARQARKGFWPAWLGELEPIK